VFGDSEASTFGVTNAIPTGHWIPSTTNYNMGSRVEPRAVDGNSLAATSALALNDEVHILFRLPWPNTEAELIERLFDTAAAQSGSYVDANSGWVHQWTPSARNEFVQQARVMRDRVGQSVWTLNVAAKFGALLSRYDDAGRHAACQQEQLNGGIDSERGSTGNNNGEQTSLLNNELATPTSPISVTIASDSSGRDVYSRERRALNG
jgi:hypothetical protein